MTKKFKVIVLTIVSVGMIFTVTSQNLRAQEVEVEDVNEELDANKELEVNEEVEAQEAEEAEEKEEEKVVIEPQEQEKIENYIATPKIGEITFPDEKIDRIVRETLGLDAETPITEVEIKKLYRLDLTEPGTYDFTGLENAASLRSLKADGAEGEINLSDLSPLFGLPITSMKFMNTVNVNDADIAQFAGILNELNLNNYVEGKSLSFLTQLVNLKTLTITGDTTTAIDASPIHTLVKLDDLYLDNITFNGTLDLQGLVKLESIAVSGSDITNLDFIDPAAPITYTLFLENSNLEDASRLASIPTIEILQVTKSKLTNIDFVSSLENLMYVYLYGNQISDMSAFENNPSTIAIFELSDNKISDISVLNTMTFSSMMAEIDLSDNKISDISSLNEFEVSVPDMELRLHNNQISDFTPLAKFEGNSDIMIDAYNQRIDLGEVEIGTPVALDIKLHLETEELNIYSPADLGSVEAHGSFTYADGMVTFNELTPSDSPSYNIMHAANFDVKSRASTNINYHMIVTANVVKTPDPVVPAEPTPTKPGNATTPNTGDVTNPILYGGLLLLSLLMLVVFVVKKRATN